MNIDPAAVNAVAVAVAVAEEIGLVSGVISAAIPNLPPLNFDIPAAAAAAASNNPVAPAAAAGVSAAANAAVAVNIDNYADAAAVAVDIDNYAAAVANNADDIANVAADDAGEFLVQGYAIEELHDVAPHVKRHGIAFYNALIPLFLEAPATWHLMDRAKYYRIMTALKLVHDGSTLSSL